MSQDNTASLLKEYALRHQKVKLYLYPFKLHQCGIPNMASSRKSVHNLSYYNNWSLSLCNFTHIIKWDADMILPKSKQEEFNKFKNLFLTSEEKRWYIGEALVVAKSGSWFGPFETFHEPRAFLNVPQNYFINNFLSFYERYSQISDEIPTYEQPLFYELRFVDFNKSYQWAIPYLTTNRQQKIKERINLLTDCDDCERNYPKVKDPFIEKI